MKYFPCRLYLPPSSSKIVFAIVCYLHILFILNVRKIRSTHDDELQGESNSISNQKRMLGDDAEKNGFKGMRHFTDDGISGAAFEHEGLQAMLAELKEGKDGTIIYQE